MIDYQACILRYRPDFGTGEQLNIGVAMFVPSTGTLLFRANPNVTRLQHAFPKLQVASYQDFVQHTQHKELLHAPNVWLYYPRDVTFDTLLNAICVRGNDYTSFQWDKTTFCGLCEEPGARFEELYVELVTKND